MSGPLATAVDALRAGHPRLPVEAGLSIEDARRRLARAFRQRGLDAPELDARILVGACARARSRRARGQAGRALTAAEADAIAAVAARRLAHEPVARIIGRKEFWGLPLTLNPETLVPRPETETVVEAALAAVGDQNQNSHVARVADLGTGSGALLLALLSELPGACGFGTDISLAALGCARENAAALGLSARTSFVACDYGAALGRPVDLLVSNPPYVARSDIAGCKPRCALSIRRRALDGGPDGLDGYRAIASDIRAPAGARWRACAGARPGSARRRDRNLCPHGACAGGGAARSYGCYPGPGHAGCGHEAFTFLVHGKKALGLWVETD